MRRGRGKTVCARGACPAARAGTLRASLDVSAAYACARPLNFTVRPQLIVDAEVIAKGINAASTWKAGSLRFWGEWFGKPHDNWHKIVRRSANGNTRLERGARPSGSGESAGASGAAPGADQLCSRLEGARLTGDRVAGFWPNAHSAMMSLCSEALALI